VVGEVFGVGECDYVVGDVCECGLVVFDDVDVV